MNPFKKLVTGQYPLLNVAIFWFITQFLISTLFKTIPIGFITHPGESLLYSILASYLLKVILGACILSGFIYHLTQKLSIKYIISSAFIILHIGFNGYLFFIFLSATL